MDLIYSIPLSQMLLTILPPGAKNLEVIETKSKGISIILKARGLEVIVRHFIAIY